MQHLKLSNSFTLSRIVAGIMRIQSIADNNQNVLSFIEQAYDLGIDSFDSADIYGNYECEKIFGNALALKPFLRNKIKIVSKCGIMLLSDKFPDRKVKYYDYSYEHIVGSVNKTLKDLRTNYIDLLLLHRPSPFFNPEEVARAFTELMESGKVLNFGVSNFLRSDIELLESYTNEKIITNQVEISVACTEHFDNGNINYLMQKRIKPMAWSPLGGGSIAKPETVRDLTIHDELVKIAAENNASPEMVALAWLLNHPAQIIPIVGTTKTERLKEAVDSLEIKLTTEQWFRIYQAARGEEVL